ncbi:MAG: toll/interleukin-1 receptor domain-containing protein [Muribaculaceae bacterium]|nr:toll/interleukin-1 receptor domain-containing protein [Muribaculaceae bacterium]
MDITIQLKNLLNLCYQVKVAINQKNAGFPNCRSYCPGEERLISSLKEFQTILRKIEPEFASSIEDNLIRLRGNPCLNPYAFGGILSVLNILKLKYLSTKENHTRIFISHSSKDKDLLTEFLDEILIDGIGLKSSEIYCTSIEGLGIRNGEDMRKHIQDNISQCDYAFIILSENYKNSEICLNEMGAVWALNKTVKLFTIPPVSYDSLGWLMEVKQVHRLNNNSGLNELYDEMTERYSLNKNATQWDRHKNKFIKFVETYLPTTHSKSV